MVLPADIYVWNTDGMAFYVQLAAEGISGLVPTCGSRTHVSHIVVSHQGTVQQGPWHDIPLSQFSLRSQAHADTHQR